MIFVTLGTQKQQFTRILEIIEQSKLLKDKKIIVQAGHTKFNSNHLEIKSFLSLEEMKKYTKEAEFIITHGGVGSIIDALNLDKKVLAVPRLSKYVEHVDNHQLEICEKLKTDGYIENLLENENLDEKIREMEQKEYKRYVSNTDYLEKIDNTIKEFLK